MGAVVHGVRGNELDRLALNLEHLVTLEHGWGYLIGGELLVLRVIRAELEDLLKSELRHQAKL